MRSNSRILAIDYGSKRIGIAISDPLGILASPSGVIQNSPTAIVEIVSKVQDQGVGLVLLGLPKHLDGGHSEMTEEVKAFSTKLFAALDSISVKYEFVDERLTSVMAAQNILQQGLKRSQRQQKYRHDEEAARIILQEYLDR